MRRNRCFQRQAHRPVGETFAVEESRVDLIGRALGRGGSSDLIASGELSAGMRLPFERVLADWVL